MLLGNNICVDLECSGVIYRIQRHRGALEQAAHERFPWSANVFLGTLRIVSLLLLRFVRECSDTFSGSLPSGT